MRGNSHVRCGVGENLEITSKDYLSLYILPSDLLTYGTEAKNLLSQLQNHDEKMFLVTIIFMNDTKYYDLAVDNPMHTNESHIHMMMLDTGDIVEISNKVVFDRVSEIIKRDYNIDIKYIKITIGAQKNE